MRTLTQGLPKNSSTTHGFGLRWQINLVNDILLCVPPHHLSHEFMQRSFVPPAVRVVHDPGPPGLVAPGVHTQEQEQALEGVKI